MNYGVLEKILINLHLVFQKRCLRIHVYMRNYYFNSWNLPAEFCNTLWISGSLFFETVFFTAWYLYCIRWKMSPQQWLLLQKCQISRKKPFSTIYCFFIKRSRTQHVATKRLNNAVTLIEVDSVHGIITKRNKVNVHFLFGNVNETEKKLV